MRSLEHRYRGASVARAGPPPPPPPPRPGTTPGGCTGRPQPPGITGVFLARFLFGWADNNRANFPDKNRANENWHGS